MITEDDVLTSIAGAYTVFDQDTVKTLSAGRYLVGRMTERNFAKEETWGVLVDFQQKISFDPEIYEKRMMNLYDKFAKVSRWYDA